MMNATQSLEELLPVRLKKFVQHYATTEDYKLSQHLAKGKHTVLLSCTLRVPGSMADLKIPLNEDPRVQVLGDLTEDRCSRQIVTIEADLTLSLQARRKSRALTTHIDELIETDSYFESRGEDTVKWYRVGNAKILENDGVTICTKRQARFWECVAYTKPILASYHPGSGNVGLYTLHAYDFIDFIVGDLKERRPCRKLGRSVELYSLFGNVRLDLTSLKGLAEGIAKFAAEEGEEGEEKGEGQEEKEEEDVNLRRGVPFLPTFCFNTFDAEHFGLGIENWPKKGIDLAIRCVNQYAQARDMQYLEFPRDIRLSVWEHEGMDDLRKDVVGYINITGLHDGVKVNSNKLFDPKHIRKWDIEFWVMPQRQRKLFRHTQGKLSQFLDDSSDVRRIWDKKLYCEAHIVPRRV